MKKLSAILLVALMCGGCGLFSEGGPLSVDKIVQCGPTTNELVPIVSRIISGDGTAKNLSQRALNELDGLAHDNGAEAIACIVKSLADSWLGRSAAPDPVRVAGAQRGNAWIADQGIEEVRGAIPQ